MKKLIEILEILKTNEKLQRLIIAVIVLIFFSWSCISFVQGRRLKFSGTVELTEHSVGARVPGRLVTLNVDEGDWVEKDELIGTLDRFDQKKRDYKRTVELFKKGGTTEQARELAELDLQDQQMISPVNGIVLVKVHELGEVLDSGSPVVVIGDRSKIWVRIYVPEGQINRIKMGQEAVIRLDGVRKTFKGHVTYIADEAEFTPRNVQTPEERVTQTFAVKVTFDNPEAYVRPGVAADVTVKV